MDFFPLATLSGRLPSGHTREYIPGGKAGTAATIRRMQDLATLGKRDFRIRKLVGQLIQQCQAKDYHCYAQAVFHYCRDGIKYAFDPNGVELVESPWDVVTAGIADCDSIVTLCAAMLESIGLPCRYVTIQADTKRPNEFSHVFLECNVRGKWIPMDCTMPDKPFGWGPSAHWPRKNWPATNDPGEDREGDMMTGLDCGDQPCEPCSRGGMHGGLGYLNDGPSWDADVVPGAADSVEVAVGNLWSWRLEDDAVPSAMNTLETDALKQRQIPMDPGSFAPEFFTRRDAPEVLAEKNQSPLRVISETVKASPNMFFWLGVGLLGWALLRSKK